VKLDGNTATVTGAGGGADGPLPSNPHPRAPRSSSTTSTRGPAKEIVDLIDHARHGAGSAGQTHGVVRRPLRLRHRAAGSPWTTSPSGSGPTATSWTPRPVIGIHSHENLSLSVANSAPAASSLPGWPLSGR